MGVRLLTNEDKISNINIFIDPFIISICKCYLIIIIIIQIIPFTLFNPKRLVAATTVPLMLS